MTSDQLEELAGSHLPWDSYEHRYYALRKLLDSGEVVVLTREEHLLQINQSYTSGGLESLDRFEARCRGLERKGVTGADYYNQNYTTKEGRKL